MARDFALRFRLPDGMTLEGRGRTNAADHAPAKLHVEPGQVGSTKLNLRVPANAGNYVVTVDIESKSANDARPIGLLQWTEALVTVE